MAKKQLKIPFKDGRPCKWVKDVHDVDVIAHLLRSIERKQINDIVKEFRKITDELMFGSLETDIM